MGVLAVALVLAVAGAAWAAESAAPPAAPAAPAVPAPSAPAAPATPPKVDMDKVSYAMGVYEGRAFKAQDIAVNVDLYVRGVKDALSGAKLTVSDEELETTLRAFIQGLRQKQMAARQAAEEKLKAEGEKAKAEGEAFLAANKTKPGVVTLPDGLQYKVITTGTGPKPTDTDSVEVNYRGTFVDGTEFDSSAKLGRPATFPVSRIIKGWSEALKLMSVGSKWQLFIPGDLAYGERGQAMGQPPIPPNKTLVFEVELLSIKPAATPAK